MKTTVPKTPPGDHVPFIVAYYVTCTVMFLGGAVFGAVVWR